MRKLLSNLPFVLIAIAGVIAKIGGFVMDILDLPDFGDKIDKLSKHFIPGDFPYYLMVFSLVILAFINFSFKSKSDNNNGKATQKKVEPNEKDSSQSSKPAPAIKFAGGRGLTVNGNVSYGPGPLLDAENVEDLNVRIDPTKLVESPPIRDWSILNALEWWENFTNKRKEDDGMDFFNIIEQLALDGDITVWGRPQSSHHPLEKITPNYWADYRFDTQRYIHLEGENEIRNTSTHPKVLARVTSIQYLDLRLTSAEVKRKWPTLNVKHKYNLKVEHKEGHPDYQQQDIMTGNSKYWSHRISILKEEGDPIDNLQVYLSDIEPRDPNIKGLPRPLHVTHEQSNPIVRVGDIPKFFDIISIPEDLEKPMLLIFADTFPNNPTMLNTEYKLFINIAVDDNIILKKQYKLVRNPNYVSNYRFTEVC